MPICNHDTVLPQRPASYILSTATPTISEISESRSAAATAVANTPSPHSAAGTNHVHRA